MYVMWNPLKRERIQAFSWETDEETVVHPFDGILLGREKERTPDTGDNRDDP